MIKNKNFCKACSLKIKSKGPTIFLLIIGLTFSIIGVVWGFLIIATIADPGYDINDIKVGMWVIAITGIFIGIPLLISSIRKLL